MITRTSGKSGALRRWVAVASCLLLSFSGVALAATAAEAATPQTIVSLTFDDSNADQVAPVAQMNTLGLHGTLYTVTGWIGAPGYQSRANLATLSANGNEIAGHTVNHPDLTTMSVSDQTQEVCQARATLTGWGYPQASFAYPFASVNATTEKVVKDCGYNSARGLGDIQSRFGCAGCDYASALPPADPYYTQALDMVDSTWTLADLQNGVTNAETHGGGWVQFTFHHICDNVCDSLSITPALFAQFTQWLAGRAATNNTVVKTVNEVVGGAVKPVVSVANSMAPAPGPGVNGIINPSLETAGTGGIPSCWTASSYGTNTPNFAGVTPGHTGSVAENLVMSGYTNGDAKLLPIMDLGDCAPTVTPGHTYSLRGWYTSSMPTQFEVYLRTDAGAWVYWTASPWLASSPLYSQGAWTTPAIPAGYNGLSFGLTAFQVGNITTDDYEMYDSVGAPAPLPTVTSGTPTISGSAQVGQTLSSDPGVWGPAPVTLAYQWLRNNAPIAGATSASYTLVGADAGQLMSLRIIGTKPGYNPSWATSGASATIALGNLTTAAPTITGAVKVGSLLTANPGVWGPGVVSFGYQWMNNGTVIAGATSGTYAPVAADYGSTLTVTVTGAELGYTSATTSSAATVAVALGDLVAPVPSISGTMQVGSALTTVPGVWGPVGTTLSYQWLRNGTPIVGATSVGYTLTPVDSTATITVAVTGTQLGYMPTTTVSVAAGAVALGTPVVGIPTISGTAKVGQVLTVQAGSWGPGTVTLSYQWMRDGIPIMGAINSVYTLGGMDAGTVLTLRVMGTQAGYTTGTATSVGTPSVASGTLTSHVPLITGTAKMGVALTASPGSWGPGVVTLSYQWLRNGVAITGATLAGYTPSMVDIGSRLSVRVTGTELGFATASVASVPTASVALGTLIAPTPKISGVLQVGNLLTAVTDSWGPSPIALSYQWLRNGRVIRGAMSSTYSVVSADYRTVLSVQVTGAKSGYATVVATSPGRGGALDPITLAVSSEQLPTYALAFTGSTESSILTIAALALMVVGAGLIRFRRWLR
jgi:peptidoglycan/xylan/chitin deacetylase (PgdA/CDA1 family)